MSGWFSVKRGITSHPVFKGRPERLAIWLWLLDNACWKDTTHDIKGKTVTVPRGSVCASERRIAEGVGVGRQVVRTFLKRLEAEHMINPDPTHGRSIISLCNWEKYQSYQAKANPAPNPELTQDQPTKGTREQSIPVGASADATPPTAEKVMFDSGIRLLTSAGKPDQQARSIIGRWRRDYGTEAVISALSAAQREEPSDPVQYCTKALQWRDQKARQQPRERPGYVNAGAFGMIREVN